MFPLPRTAEVGSATMEFYEYDARGLSPSSPPRRPPYRVPTSLPVRGAEPRRWSALVSVALHGFILLLIIAPFAGREIIEAATQGAGGAGPAGGGGGGSGGSGGQRVPEVERLRYIQVPPAPDALTPPEEEKPEEEKPEEEKLLLPTVDIRTDMPTTPLDLSLAAGIGGGTGSDGSQGTGPGRGGGVGSGVGTGRGSSVGPGTGGGEGTIYPPTPTELVVPPLPVPSKVQGTELVAVFEVDERGNVLKVTFPPTRDGGYNRRLRQRLESYRFRPATTWEGTPVRAQAFVTLEL